MIIILQGTTGYYSDYWPGEQQGICSARQGWKLFLLYIIRNIIRIQLNPIQGVSYTPCATSKKTFKRETTRYTPNCMAFSFYILPCLQIFRSIRNVFAIFCAFRHQPLKNIMIFRYF